MKPRTLCLQIVAIGVFSSVLSTVAYTETAIQGFSDARSVVGHISGDSFGFATGASYILARGMLLDPQNFGPSGTVLDPISFLPAVDDVSVSALQAADVFVISPIATSLSSSEVCLLETYVRAGGALLEVRNAFPGRPTILGTAPGTFVSDATADIVEWTSSLIVGPFGGAYFIGTGANGNYSSTGDAIAVTTNSGPGGSGPNVLQLEATPTSLGRAVFIGDEEIFMNGNVGGERAGQLSESNDNDTLLLNVFAFLAQAPGLSADVDYSACAAPALDELVSDVVSANLKMGISNSLDAKLQNASQALDDINAKNDGAALNKLQAFSNEVLAQSDVHISAQIAQQLHDKAQQIKQMIQ